MPKPPPKPPKPPSGGGGNTNNCNTLCNAIPSGLALANALNAAAMPGEKYILQLNYNPSPTQTVVITVTGVNLQNCTIRGIDQATSANVTVSCAYAFANFVDLQVTSVPV